MADESRPASKKSLRAGRIVSAVPVFMLLFGGGMKISRHPTVLDAFQKLGYAESVILPIGVVEIFCTILYLVPRTSVLGAILLTGYLGGAISTHVRIGDAWIGAFVFGVLLWLGLYLREPKLRSLVPLKR